MLLLSLFTWAAGAFVYWQRPVMLSAPAALLDRLPVTGDRVYDATMDGIARFSAGLTLRMQSGIQRRYIRAVFATLALSVGVTLVAKDAIHLPSQLPSVTFVEWALVAVITGVRAHRHIDPFALAGDLRAGRGRHGHQPRLPAARGA